MCYTEDDRRSLQRKMQRWNDKRLVYTACVTRDLTEVT